MNDGLEGVKKLQLSLVFKANKTYLAEAKNVPGKQGTQKSEGTWKQDGNTLTASSNGGGRELLTFESQEPVPSKWERFDPAGALELSAQFQEYISTSAGLFPLSLVLEAPAQKRELHIRYKEPEINAQIPDEQFTQQIPAHVKEVPIEAVGD